MDNEQIPAKASRIKILSVIAAAVILVVVMVGGIWLIVKNATAEPTRVDYLHLDNQRKAVSVSLDAYDPILEDFTSRYNTAYKEDFSTDQKTDIKEKYDKQFNDEVTLGERRLHNMDGSLALKNESVKAKYQQFSHDYNAMVDYLKQSKSTATQVVEVITGVCREVVQIKSTGDYAKKFVDQSQICMDKLAEAKKHVTPSAKVMMTSLQKMYKTRQDTFKDAVNEKNETLQIALKSAGLFSLLGINSELAKIQADYSAAESKAYENVQSNVTKSGDTLQKALEQAANQAESEKE